MQKKLMIAVAVAGLVACGGETDTKPDDQDNNTSQNNTEPNNTEPNNTEPNNTEPNNTEPNNVDSSDLTYFQDVKPIIDANCVGCHTAGAIGPFQLTTYEEVSAVGPALQAAVQNLQMPPFIYASECRDYTHDPSLSEEQIDTIVDWVDADMPEGDPETEPPPLQVEAPEPPDFDTTLEMPIEYTPRQSPDDYRCFVVDWPHDTQKYVTGFGVEPGNDSIVHHVIGFIAPPSAVATAEALDAGEGEPGDGYTCFGGPGFDDTGWVGSWAPGGQPARYPDTTGIGIEPGSKMVIQVHYNTLSEEPSPDLTKLHFETADDVDNPAIFMPWANPQWLNGSGMNIAAGDANATASFAYDPTSFIDGVDSVQIWGAGLHMHLLGTSMRGWIQRSDGTETCLADTPRWDFNWQTGVMFEEPTVLNSGDRLSIECHWDNSMENQPIINGERATPEDRSWGEGSLDEMCLGVFYMTF